MSDVKGVLVASDSCEGMSTARIGGSFTTAAITLGDIMRKRISAFALASDGHLMTTRGTVAGSMT